MIFRRGRFHELVERQLDLFETDTDLVDEAAEADAAWTSASADESEELYGDYQLVVDAIGDELLGIRESYASTLRQHWSRRVPERLRQGGAQALRPPRVLPRRLSANGEEPPRAGNALELGRPAILELEARACDEVADGARDEHFAALGPSGRPARRC